MRFPFAGVISERPYPPTGLTTARWAAEVEPVAVVLADLWLTQPHVGITALFGLSDRVSDLYPHVVRWQDVPLLEDGHHRVVRVALTTNAESMLMRVFTAPT